MHGDHMLASFRFMRLLWQQICPANLTATLLLHLLQYSDLRLDPPTFARVPRVSCPTV